MIPIVLGVRGWVHNELALVVSLHLTWLPLEHHHLECRRRSRWTPFSVGCLRNAGLLELGRFLRIDFSHVKLDDAWSSSKGTDLLVSISTFGVFLRWVEDTDAAFGLFWTLEGGARAGGCIDSTCGGSDF
jgi:hypothetical protein